MVLRSLPLLACAAWLVAGAVSAEETWAEQLSRGVELPAHRWLEQVRTAPGAARTAFTTDGCSGGMSAVWAYLAERFPEFAALYAVAPPWESCCVTHDRAYHGAGDDPAPDASYDARLSADLALRSCVAATVEVAGGAGGTVLQERYGLTPEQEVQLYEAVAAAMFQAVRLGGGPCTGLTWRWGYGWPQCWSPQPD